MTINGKTRTCGLIGNPVEHTMSPQIHNFIAESLGIDMVYVPFFVDSGELGAAVKGAYGLNILGMNVTVPYKNDVINYLADIDARAKNIGAVNTLVRVDGGYKGYNTDISGLERAMRSDGVFIDGEEVIILGAGGVGRAVAFMCASYNVKKAYLLNRSVEKAVAIADEVNKALNTDCIAPMPLGEYGSLSQNGEKKYIVIQCTSVGLFPNVDAAVIEDMSFYGCVKVGYDLIYTPWETKFMKLVRQSGAPAHNGLKMLLYQAVDAFELWNGCKVPNEIADKAYELLKNRQNVK